MINTLITVVDLDRWNACECEYSDEKLARLLNGREGVTVREVFYLPIPAKDKIWLLCHEGILPDRILHEFICRIAEVALHAQSAAGREPDKRSWAVICMKRRWLAGEINDNELAAASAAAMSVAMSAANAAVSVAINHAANTAADIAASAITWSAVRSAAIAAEISAVWSAAVLAADLMARSAAWSAAISSIAKSTAIAAAREWQLVELRNLIDVIEG